jgi:hypothetical protein
MTHGADVGWDAARLDPVEAEAFEAVGDDVDDALSQNCATDSDERERGTQDDTGRRSVLCAGSLLGNRINVTTWPTVLVLQRTDTRFDPLGDQGHACNIERWLVSLTDQQLRPALDVGQVCAHGSVQSSILSYCIHVHGLLGLLDCPMCCMCCTADCTVRHAQPVPSAW